MARLVGVAPEPNALSHQHRCPDVRPRSDRLARSGQCETVLMLCSCRGIGDFHAAQRSIASETTQSAPSAAIWPALKLDNVQVLLVSS